jgi:RND superfamily putative drug exporter
VQRRPWTAAVVGAAVLIALASPALGLRLGFPDAGNDREGTTTRAAYELVSKGFGPGANSPLLLAAELPRSNDATAALNGCAASWCGRTVSPSSCRRRSIAPATPA